ncbi:glycosyltransferase family 2 protein [Puniceicoccaceae bacterium K14]|nr:glycosyltransferase family 2 protein [Puniceicoccaceae bacterium K14]
MRASIIISTYNSPLWLQKVLWGYTQQSDKEFEILIADDGSNEICRNEIKRIIEQSPLKIRHIWHPDKGFRKTLILNKALLASKYEYIVFSDGDCIPHPNFVSVHKRFASKGSYLSGGYVKLPMALSQSLSQGDIRSGHAFKIAWLRKHGFFNLRSAAKLSNNSLSRILDFLTTTRPTLNGQNSSGWKKDIFKANGFDNRMVYGAEDSELGIRLNNLGIRGIQIRHSAACLHLDHPRSYVSKEGWAFNRRIRSETQRSRAKTTPHGLREIGEGIFLKPQNKQRQYSQSQ